MEMLWMLLEALDPGRFFGHIFEVSSLTVQETPGSWAKTHDGPGFPPPPPK